MLYPTLFDIMPAYYKSILNAKLALLIGIGCAVSTMASANEINLQQPAVNSSSVFAVNNQPRQQSTTKNYVITVKGIQANVDDSDIVVDNQNSDSAWLPDIKDPIGSLIKEAKVARARRDAALSGQEGAGPELADAALNYLGVRYRFGGTSPKTGFDCSGLIYYTAHKYMGIELPRVAAQMANIGTNIGRSDLKPGDLVFFNTRGHRFSHVGIYVGDNKFVHSPRTGAVVRVENLSTGYWAKRYNGARRIEERRVASR